MSLSPWPQIESVGRRLIDYAARKLKSAPDLPFTVLLDVDGVLLDLNAQIMTDLHAYVRKNASTQPGWGLIHEDMFKSWHLHESIAPVLRSEELAREWINATLERGEFWRAVPPMPCAAAIIDAVRTIDCEVIAVTSPWLSCHEWVDIRRQRLSDDFGIKKTLMGAHKSHVFGDVLFEDKPANMEGWLSAWPSGFGVFVAHPYNRHEIPRLMEIFGGRMTVLEPKATDPDRLRALLRARSHSRQ